MTLFRSYTFTCAWWQISIFKIALLALGIAIGAYWHDFFGTKLVLLIIIAIVAGAYTAYVFWESQKKII